MFDVIAIIAGLMCIVSIVSTGNVALKKINKNEKTKNKLSWHEELSYSTGIGLILFATWAFLVNLLGYGYWFVLSLPVLAGILVTANKLQSILQTTEQIKNTVFSSGTVIKIACTLFVVLFAVGFLVALAPPSTTRPGPIDYDSLNYHLVISKLYLQQHSLEHLPFLAYDNWPHSLETFYTIPMSLGGVSAVKIVMLFISFAMLLALYSLARRFVKSEQAIIAPLIFFTSPVVFLFLGSAYVDAALAFFVVLALMSLHSWTTEKKWQQLALVGVFAGFAASIKLIGLLPLALVSIIALYLLVKEKKILLQLVPFGVLASLFIAPWLLRTFLATGNPIFPLFYSPLQLLGINNVGTEYFMHNWAQGAIVSGAGNTLLDFLLLPWNMTMHGNLFNGIISPLYLAFAPLLLLSLWRKKTTMFEMLLVTFSVLFTALWFYTYQETRFYEPVLAIGAVLATIAASRFSSTEVQAICTKATLLVTGGAVVIMFLYSVSAFPVALGLEAKEIYLNRTLDTYAPCQFINGDIDVKQVLFYKVENAYYCDKKFVYTFSYDADRASSANELITQLQQDGFTHVLAHKQSKTRGIGEFFNTSQPIYTANNLALYKIPT